MPWKLSEILPYKWMQNFVKKSLYGSIKQHEFILFFYLFSFISAFAELAFHPEATS